MSKFPYGKCPECGGAGVERERCSMRCNGGNGGYDYCENGHKYFSKDAILEVASPRKKTDFKEWVKNKNSKLYNRLFN